MKKFKDFTFVTYDYAWVQKLVAEQFMETEHPAMRVRKVVPYAYNMNGRALTRAFYESMKDSDKAKAVAVEWKLHVTTDDAYAPKELGWMQKILDASSKYGMIQFGWTEA